MTRKRIGQGLLEVFSEPCEACQGRGYHVHSEPVVAKAAAVESEGPVGRTRKRRGGDEGDEPADTEPTKGKRKTRKATSSSAAPEVEPRAIDPKASEAMEKIHAAAAKRAADAAAAAAGDSASNGSDQPAPSDATAPVEEVREPAPESHDEPESAPAAPARRARGPRKATRKAGPAAVTEGAAASDVTGDTAG
jgi:ribonuclease E